MVLETGVAPRSSIDVIDNDEDTMATVWSGADSTVAAVNYNAKENRAEQMNRHEKVRSSQNIFECRLEIRR